MRAIRRGGTLIAALVTLIVVMLLAATLLRSLIAFHRRTRLGQAELQAQWLAEAAIERAKSRLAINGSYEGEIWRPGSLNSDAATGVAVIRVEPSAEQQSAARVVVDAHFPDHPSLRAQSHREIVFPRSKASAPSATTRAENSP